MSRPLTHRRFVMQLVPLLGLPATLGLLLLAPMHKEHRAVRGQVDRAVETVRIGTAVARMPRVDPEVEPARQAEAIMLGSDLAREVDVLVGTIQSLADEAGIDIVELDASGAPAVDATDDVGNLSRAIECTIELMGDQPNLIEFISALHQRGGILAIRRCTLEPTLDDDQNRTRLLLRTEHFHFHHCGLTQVAEYDEGAD